MRPLSSHHTLQSGYKECYPSTKESYHKGGPMLPVGQPDLPKVVRMAKPIFNQSKTPALLKGG